MYFYCTASNIFMDVNIVDWFCPLDCRKQSNGQIRPSPNRADRAAMMEVREEVVISHWPSYIAILWSEFGHKNVSYAEVPKSIQ